MESPIRIRLGRRARARIATHGLQASDIALVPAAAGGPKALILHELDCFLFGHWLAAAPRPRRLIGASMGAWRMAAAALDDPAAAQRRLVRLYADQPYPRKPDAAYVSRACRGVLDDMLDGRGGEALRHPQHRLTVLATRGIGTLARAGRWREVGGFLLAAANNAVARARLARWLERVVFHDRRDDAAWLQARFDAFAAHFVGLTEANLAAALLASGAIPRLLEAVDGIPGAPPGVLWDGGLIDYHLHLPYQREPDLVLYPHFAAHLVPGWLDKSLPWRRARDAALENVILVAPSPSFIASLPNGKLPDRRDFKWYGQNNQGRARDWRRGIAESGRLAEAFARWAERPDLRLAEQF